VWSFLTSQVHIEENFGGILSRRANSECFNRLLIIADFLGEPTKSISTIFRLEDYLGETKRSWSESEHNVKIFKSERFVGQADARVKWGVLRKEQEHIHWTRHSSIT